MPDLIGHLHFYPRKSHNCLATRHSPSLCLGIKKSESLSRFAPCEIRWRLCSYLLNFLFLVNIVPKKYSFGHEKLLFNPLYNEQNLHLEEPSELKTTIPGSTYQDQKQNVNMFWEFFSYCHFFTHRTGNINSVVACP